MGVYESLGLQPIINVSGSVTRLGGAPTPAAVIQAYCDAAAEAVPLELLQGVASRIIAEITGAEAGLVTSGAAAALTLGAAAILTGYDVGRMERLPQCDGFPYEFVIAREQRNPYDHAVRAAGARLVEVGFHEPAAGSGVRRCEAWEFAAAIGPQTAGVLYVHDCRAQPPLAEVVAVAHARNLPVLVDAAGELPPRTNLCEILATGADLVAFSGGKGIRGPQATGILCGRRDLIGAAALQMLDMDDHYELWEPPPELIDKSRLAGMPRQGIGRAQKVSKEQIVALLTALRLFASGQYDDERNEMRSHLERIVAGLTDAPASCRLLVPSDGQSPPILEIALDEGTLGRTAFDICRRLRHGRPPIYVGHGLLPDGKLVLHPLHLTEARTTELLRRLREELRA
jgi:L-seryl-tRNA(Ser) seleniumtransferase